MLFISCKQCYVQSIGIAHFYLKCISIGYDLKIFYNTYPLESNI